MTTATEELTLKELIKILPDYDPYDDCEGYYFDEEKAADAILWIESCCTFTKGKQFAGKPLLLEPWEKAVVANTFGWLDEEDGSRRYREIFIYVPRKNGKTELMAAMNLFVLFTDQEQGAEIYSAASTEDQAKIVWNVSAIMIANNPLLDDNSFTFKKSITHDQTNSFYKPVTADPDSKHGFNAHCVTIDELHACDEATVDVLETSQGARWQPLFFYTTTADFDRESICNKTHDRACKVRDGVISDPAFLPIIYEASIDDDWRSEETWKKANPNYGVSLQIKYFKRKFNKACTVPSFENTFKRLHLNMKTEQSRRWIKLDLWDKCGKPFDRDIENFRGKRCYAGLDLASTIDTASLVLVFPDDGFKIIPYFWIPKDTAEDKEKTDKVPYRQWEKDGLIKLTPGNRIDYSFIKKQIIDICKVVDMVEIGYDQWNATQLSIQLTEEHSLPMSSVVQGFRSQSEPCKRIEADMAKMILNHGGNPILRSHASNVSVKEDPAGNIKIDKQKSSEKVDGMAALADAYACWLANDEQESVYENRGILVVGGDDDEDDEGWREYLDEDGQDYDAT